MLLGFPRDVFFQPNAVRLRKTLETCINQLMRSFDTSSNRFFYNFSIFSSPKPKGGWEGRDRKLFKV